MVENDDGRDAEERRVARFLSTGYKCQLSNGRPSYANFTASQLHAAHDECQQLARDQLDMVLMGQLLAVCQSDPTTQKTKAKNIA